MTDFDKLIKEKAEQAEYTYKPSAWRRFQRMSGLGRAATRYWVAGVSSALLVGGVVAFMGFHRNQGAPTDNGTPAVAVFDTLTSQPMSVSLGISDTFVVTKSDMASSSSTSNSGQRKQKQENSITIDATTIPAANSAPEQTKTPRYGRPLVIDVDTIKENVPTDEELKNGNSRIF